MSSSLIVHTHYMFVYKVLHSSKHTAYIIFIVKFTALAYFHKTQEQSSAGCSVFFDF